MVKPFNQSASLSLPDSDTAPPTALGHTALEEIRCLKMEEDKKEVKSFKDLGKETKEIWNKKLQILFQKDLRSLKKQTPNWPWNFQYCNKDIYIQAINTKKTPSTWH